MTDTPTLVDVLVVGAGPTGCSAAIELARRGHDIRIVDSAESGFEGSRAKGIQPRTLEVFDDFGIVDDLLASGGKYPPMGIHLGPITIPLRMSADKSPTDAVPYPNTWLVPQRSTSAILRNRLSEMGVDVEVATELLDVVQADDHVTARVRTSDGEETIGARYVIGADGGSSRVRKSQNIAFHGTTDDSDRIVIVDAVTTGLRRDRWHVWPGLKGRFSGACPLPHSEQFQWMLKLHPDDDADLNTARIVTMIGERTGNSSIVVGEVVWKSLFRPNIRLAARYRDRRVFVAGDAAHVHTPAGAQGLNTGIQDGYNLGWKLSQVICGAPEALLDTYEAERRPIAADVLGLSSDTYAGMGKLKPSALKRGEKEQQLALTYRGGPLIPAESKSTLTLQVGDRAPDAHLISRNGGRKRMFDLFRGEHFTLVSYGPRTAQNLRDIVLPTQGAAFVLVAVNPGHADTTGISEVVSDGAGGFAMSYGITEDTLILVRPDGYIGALTHADNLATVERAVAAMTPGATCTMSNPI